MNINTKHFGAIDIIEENILTFPEGLPGFENEKSFILFHEMDSIKGKRIVSMHECDFEDLVELGPFGHCKTVYIPLCDLCRNRRLLNVGKMKQFTGSDSYINGVNSTNIPK